MCGRAVGHAIAVPCVPCGEAVFSGRPLCKGPLLDGCAITVAGVCPAVTPLVCKFAATKPVPGTGTPGLADMAAPPRTPQSPPARLGKDKESWDVLLVEERAAAEKLGWTPESWEHGDPPVCSSAWETLDAEQRAAATALGYERVIWDVEYEVDQPHTPGKDKEYWCLLTLHEKHAATALGYERCSWDQGWHVEKTTTPWAALNQWNRTDAADLGYTPELWDAEIEGEIGAVPVMPTTTLKMRALDSGLSSSLAGASSCADLDGGASSDTRHGLNAPLPILDVRRRPPQTLCTRAPFPLNQLSCVAAVAAAARAGRSHLRPARPA